MKVGILTFHWACNYGAVLQAYALSKVCEKEGCNTEIIDYFPKKYKKNIINAFLTPHISRIPSRIKELKKERKIEEFRQAYLKRTRYFKSNNQLRKYADDFDCYICGSDQVWNMSFIQYGEGKKTFTYFLDFVPDNKKKISYAASFGCINCKDEFKEDISKYLADFDFISVRETSGADIVNDLGIKNCRIVPDPTLLLKKDDYLKLASNNTHDEKYAFVYMLHNKYEDALDIIKNIKSSGYNILESKGESIEDWLGNIKNSELVITNSFHGTVFSVLFEIPFITVLIEGSGMNDRIFTLLKTLGLEDRIYRTDMDISDKNIDWNSVRLKLDEYREVGLKYLSEALS